MNNVIILPVEGPGKISCERNMEAIETTIERISMSKGLFIIVFPGNNDSKTILLVVKA